MNKVDKLNEYISEETELYNCYAEYRRGKGWWLVYGNISAAEGTERFLGKSYDDAVSELLYMSDLEADEWVDDEGDADEW